VHRRLTRLKPGSMDPERTTTTGDSLPVTHMRAFQMMSADEMIMPGVKGQGERGTGRGEYFWGSQGAGRGYKIRKDEHP